ncbi:MAG: hypothetical protein AAGF12_20750, partial [Myxococcota bacterium]
ALAFLTEDVESAEEALREARAFWEGDPSVPETVGISLAAHYRFEEAIEFLSQALALDSQSASIHFELGSNQLRVGDPRALAGEEPNQKEDRKEPEILVPVLSSAKRDAQIGRLAVRRGLTHPARIIGFLSRHKGFVGRTRRPTQLSAGQADNRT